MTTFWVIMALAVIVPVVIGIFCRRWAQNYRANKSDKVCTVGQALGLSHRVSKSGLSRILREIPLFSLGRSHSILYALEGECDGVTITVFELQSNSGSSNTRSNSGVYLLMRSHQLQSPAFELEPSDMHLGSAMKFDSHPKFARRFWLKGHRDNEDAVRSLFTPTFLTFLLERRQRFRLWGSGPYLLYSGSGVNDFNQITRASKLRAFLKDGLTVLSQFVPEAAAIEFEAIAPTPTKPSPRPATSNQDLLQAAASRRRPQVTQWNPPKLINLRERKQKKRIAKLIVDLVAGGGTYKPQVQGLGAATYTCRQGRFVYIAPKGDPREAIMRGESSSSCEREASRDGLERIIQAAAENFFPVLNPENGDRVEQAMAEQLLAAIESQGVCNLTDDAYKIRIEPINGRFIYQCDVPVSRYQFKQIQRSFNRDDAMHWLMEHDRRIFAKYLDA